MVSPTAVEGRSEGVAPDAAGDLGEEVGHAARNYGHAAGLAVGAVVAAGAVVTTAKKPDLGGGEEGLRPGYTGGGRRCETLAAWSRIGALRSEGCNAPPTLRARKGWRALPRAASCSSSLGALRRL